MKAYYARCQAIYGTAQEKLDIDLIVRLGYAPMQFPPQSVINERKWAGDDVMETIFKPLVEMCQILVFRALPDGRISAGVIKEIDYARQKAIPVLELPSNVLSRGMSVEQTIEYLYEVGRR